MIWNKEHQSKEQAKPQKLKSCLLHRKRCNAIGSEASIFFLSPDLPNPDTEGMDWGDSFTSFRLVQYLALVLLQKT